MSAPRIAKILLTTQAVTVRIKPPYTWTSGIQSPIYCDNRLVLSYPSERTIIVNAFANLVKTHKLYPQVIAGTATAGIPWGALLAAKLKLPFAYVRKSSKGHGKTNQIEGIVRKGQKVLLIEDLISTGGSSLDCVVALKKAGAKILGIAAIFTYKLPITASNFKKSGTLLWTLTDFPTLIQVAVKQKYLAQKSEKTVLAWAKNPEHWHPEK